ncbi:hypothetical protein [Lentibacillus salicampi]|uniref:DUF4901 domain-containing protein n=1 Tax=Lentibacillus salicampi TaxID=175306 RepID=A0A4Y9AAL5_9BACI|nr:hypothetical protein [Lentibacillus salicampi]TFJ92949.1 hypothetical protein E4U82_09690 [Lentibacillus salicampi]
MDEKLRNVVDHTQAALGLHNHRLERYHFFREKNHLNETAYILNMEWFPEGVASAEDGLNPAGTAVADVNFYTGAVRGITFVDGINSADNSLYPTASTKEEVIEWVEDMTGLTFGRQFRIERDDKQVLRFAAAVDNIPVSPGGIIRTEFNDDGVLMVFYIDGEFPEADQIEWEPFALTPDKYEPVAKAQCQLVAYPDEAQEKWVAVYGLEEVFLTNDASRTIPFTIGEDTGSFVEKDDILRWDKPLDGNFEQKDIDLSPEVTLETVLADEPHPDSLPLTESEMTACVQEVLRFMRLVYPNESGKRKLIGFLLKDGYIIAELKPAEEKMQKMFGNKIKLVIERDTLTAIHYIDQSWLLEGFKHFAEATKPVVTVEEAFDLLREYLQVDPVYVYDNSRDHYMMCGKIDCDYGVNAMTGKVIKLSEMA